MSEQAQTGMPESMGRDMCVTWSCVLYRKAGSHGIYQECVSPVDEQTSPCGAEMSVLHRMEASDPSQQGGGGPTPNPG